MKCGICGKEGTIFFFGNCSECDKLLTNNQILREFWKEIEHINYMNMVTNYKDNKFNEILKKYGLKRTCVYCKQKLK